MKLWSGQPIRRQELSSQAADWLAQCRCGLQVSEGLWESMCLLYSTSTLPSVSRNSLHLDFSRQFGLNHAISSLQFTKRCQNHFKLLLMFNTK